MATTALRRLLQPSAVRIQKYSKLQQQRCQLSGFSFAGPRTLDEIIHKDKMKGTTGAQLADIWYTYHETKVVNTIDWFMIYV
jgi:hypothetical protein